LSVGADESPDLIMGNWEGQWKNESGESGKVTAQIVALGGDEYLGVVTIHSPDASRSKSVRIPMPGKREGDDITFTGTTDLGEEFGGVTEWVATIRSGNYACRYKNARSAGTSEMRRVLKKPPTLGAKPPEGAIVLFDGSSLDEWTHRDGHQVVWEIKNGAMEVARKTIDGKSVGGDIVTKRHFGDHQLHIEFRTPLMPKARGQGRGNSGVYIAGRHEVQVLDSFGEPPRDNEAGGIYSQATPRVNAALPPGEWQAYDITFAAARFNDSGQMIKPAVISVDYNGERIHDHVELSKPTPGGVDSDMTKPGGLLLQDHGNPVQFRNIWVLPLRE
jgi:hypothetical protein